MTHPTIAAIATGTGPGGIAIVRLSGPQALAIAAAAFRPRKAAWPLQPFRMHLGAVVDADDQPIDQVLCCLMRAPHSYTTEDLVEFHAHGGPVVIRRIFGALIDRGAQPAQPGEFTRRAFLGGRIDLSQAEAVAELVAARSETEAALALGQLEGGLSRRVAEIRAPLLDLLARLEVALDFPDDETDVLETWSADRVHREVLVPLEALLDDYRRNRIHREGLCAAIVGTPNVGKSSLLNALAREGKAIVTGLPGTTRDVIEAPVLIRGLPMILVDTAGLESPPADEVEEEGQRRALDRLSQADLVLLVLDQSRPLGPGDWRLLDRADRDRTLVVRNKIDLPLAWGPDETAGLEGRDQAAVSARSGQDIPKLERRMYDRVTDGRPGPEKSAVVPNLRHHTLLKEAAGSAARVREGFEAGWTADILAFEVRSGLDALGRITGETVTGDLLDRIFSSFCLGK